MSPKYIVLSCAVCLLAGTGLGRFSLPAKVVTKTIVVDNTRTDTKIDDHSTTTTTKKPDGTIITVIHKDVGTTKHETEQARTETEKIVTRNTERWTISALAVTRISTKPQLLYGGQVEYRILGPFKVGALVLQDGTIGASLGFSF